MVTEGKIAITCGKVTNEEDEKCWSYPIFYLDGSTLVYLLCENSSNYTLRICALLCI